MSARRHKVDPSEQAFLAGYDASEFPHPSLAVDVVLLTVSEEALQVSLVQRVEHPCRECWALPGGFVDMKESLDAAAARVLAAKAGLEDVFVEQLYTFGAPERDPRTRVVSVAYYALVHPGRLAVAGSAEFLLGRLQVPWSGDTGGPVQVAGEDGEALRLAFDHAEVIGMAVKRIRGKLDYAPIGFQLLPPTFTLRDLQAIHEVILGRPLNKDSFRRRMLASGELRATGKRERTVGHRPAELYRYSVGGHPDPDRSVTRNG